MVRWMKANDTNLIKLLQDKTLDLNDMNRNIVEMIQGSYFPEFTYKNVGPLYCGKLCKWNIDKSLSGKRLG